MNYSLGVTNMRVKRVFIVGHSGAGKGVLARELAETLGWQFIDADVLGCVAHIGRSPTDVLGSQGEQAFYHCLTEILSQQLNKDNIVVTTDESIVFDKKARELLKSECTVYLKVSPEVQSQRITEVGYRPLLPVTNFSHFLNEMHKERNGLYEEVASFSLSSDDGDIDTHVASVVNFIK